MSTKRFAPPILHIATLLILRRQQAYLEFFVSPGLLDALLPHIQRDPSITYHVINKRGDLRTNTHSEGPNAVTWGVFPGKEIVQPTIVEAISFMAWKVRLPLLDYGFQSSADGMVDTRTKHTSWASSGPTCMTRVRRAARSSISSWRTRSS